MGHLYRQRKKKKYEDNVSCRVAGRSCVLNGIVVFKFYGRIVSHGQPYPPSKFFKMQNWTSAVARNYTWECLVHGFHLYRNRGKSLQSELLFKTLLRFASWALMTYVNPSRPFDFHRKRNERISWCVLAFCDFVRPDRVTDAPPCKTSEWNMLRRF